MTLDSRPLDPQYLSFLREKLPTLSKQRLPYWRRSKKSKHDTLRYTLAKRPFLEDGLMVEFGVFKGVTLTMMANALPKRIFYGFDSFEGFPEDNRKDWQHDFSLNGQLPNVPSNVTLVKGFFEESLPEFVATHKGKQFAFMHIDCDIYSSTKTIFDTCSQMIQPGCVIVFDELLHYQGFEHHELKAFYEFLIARNLDFEWLSIRNKVLGIDAYLAGPNAFPQVKDPLKMQSWRDAGYEQEVAVRIVAP